MHRWMRVALLELPGRGGWWTWVPAGILVALVGLLSLLAMLTIGMFIVPAFLVLAVAALLAAPWWRPTTVPAAEPLPTGSGLRGPA